MDRKMEMFIDPKRINDIIEHGVEKKFPRETLSIFSDPRGRVIVADAIEQGRYKVMPPQIIQIPKKNTKEKRKVYANSPLDRFVLALINSIYYDLYKHLIHPSCVSYQQGIGVGTIIKKITVQLSKQLSGYKVDLSKYFDSVNLETIEEYLKLMDTKSPLDQVLWEYYHDNVVIDEKGETVSKYKSLAQGCAFGTLLANLVLRDIDAELSNMDILYYRYSDDLLILGDDAERALEVLKDRLSNKGLQLNPKKVFAINSGEAFTFLGFKIDGQMVSLSEESVLNYKKKIRQITKNNKQRPIKKRETQIKAIRQINAYLYNDYLKDDTKFGWMEYFTPISTDEQQMKMLDEFTKDHIKAMYTGKNNHTTNHHKTTNDDLIKMGYRSMVHMYKLRRINKNLYEAALINGGDKNVKHAV